MCNFAAGSITTASKCTWVIDVDSSLAVVPLLETLQFAGAGVKSKGR